MKDKESFTFAEFAEMTEKTSCTIFLCVILATHFIDFVTFKTTLLYLPGFRPVLSGPECAGHGRRV